MDSKKTNEDKNRKQGSASQDDKKKDDKPGTKSSKDKGNNKSGAKNK